jgi:hypothetical protein
MQTERHGYVNLERILNMVPPSSKFSNKTMFTGNFKNNERDYKQSHELENTISEVENPDILTLKSSSNQGLSKFNGIKQSISLESNSVSEDSNKPSKNRHFEDVSKIIISPLEKVTTIKSIGSGGEKMILSKVIDSITTPVAKAKVIHKDVDNRKSADERVKPMELDLKTPESTTRLFKKQTFEIPQNVLHLQGEKIKQIKEENYTKRNITGRERGVISSLMTERISMGTSIDDLKEPMEAVYDNSNTFILINIDLASLQTRSAFSPQPKSRAKIGAGIMYNENNKQVQSPNRFIYANPSIRPMTYRNK